MKIFIFLLSILNFIIGRHLNQNRINRLVLNCHRDCFFHPVLLVCKAKRQQLCPLLNQVKCQLQAATCKWRNGACLVKQNTCANHCVQAPPLIVVAVLPGQAAAVNNNPNCM